MFYHYDVFAESGNFIFPNRELDDGCYVQILSLEISFSTAHTVFYDYLYFHNYNNLVI